MRGGAGVEFPGHAVGAGNSHSPSALRIHVLGAVGRESVGWGTPGGASIEASGEVVGAMDSSPPSATRGYIVGAVARGFSGCRAYSTRCSGSSTGTPLWGSPPLFACCGCGDRMRMGARHSRKRSRMRRKTRAVPV